MSADYAVIVIGAGPYGLAAAAHLRAAKIETRVFGRAMDFWSRQMPEGMLLRSSWDASHISHPRGGLTLDAFEAARASPLPKPVPLQNFVDYGLWFQQNVVPDLDDRSVELVEPAPDGFRIVLADGDFTARRVVVAAGIASFAHRPAVVGDLPPAFASHTSDHRDLGMFRGRRVLVVGAGQSAIESAALLAERGADVEVLVRSSAVRWLRKYTSVLSRIDAVRRLMYPPTDVGPPVLNRIVAKPGFFKRFPERWQEAIAYRCIRPAATGWLLPRVSSVQITTGVVVTAVRTNGSGVIADLSDGSTRSASHILLATGYRVDVRKYPFLGPDLLARLRCLDGYPELGSGFESSVPGLHFLGAPAALTFGPVMRFVSGTSYTAGALTRKVARELGVGTAQKARSAWSAR